MSSKRKLSVDSTLSPKSRKNVQKTEKTTEKTSGKSGKKDKHIGNTLPWLDQKVKDAIYQPNLTSNERSVKNLAILRTVKDDGGSSFLFTCLGQGVPKDLIKSVDLEALVKAVQKHNANWREVARTFSKAVPKRSDLKKDAQRSWSDEEKKKIVFFKTISCTTVAEVVFGNLKTDNDELVQYVKAMSHQVLFIQLSKQDALPIFELQWKISTCIKIMKHLHGVDGPFDSTISPESWACFYMQGCKSSNVVVPDLRKKEALMTWWVSGGELPSQDASDGDAAKSETTEKQEERKHGKKWESWKKRTIVVARRGYWQIAVLRFQSTYKALPEIIRSTLFEDTLFPGLGLFEKLEKRIEPEFKNSVASAMFSDLFGEVLEFVQFALGLLRLGPVSLKMDRLKKWFDVATNKLKPPAQNAQD